MASSPLSTSSLPKRKPKPLMLKDFLRIDNLNSVHDTSVSGFRSSSSSTTVLFLLEVDAREAGAVGRNETFWWRRNNLSTKLSAVLNTVKTLPFLSSQRRSSGGRTILTRSFSRRFAMRNFWKKRIVEEEELKTMNCGSFSGNKLLVRDIVRFGSFLDNSLSEKNVTSGRNSFSCSSSGWSESTISTGTSYGSDSVPSSSSPSSSEFIKTEKMSGSGNDTAVTVSCRCEEPKGNHRMAGACNRCEDKEQFSPISVMDFSYAEEDEEEEVPTIILCSELENKRHHLIQKIRRFRSFSQFDPITIQRSFDSELEPEAVEREEEDDGNEEEEGARELLEELLKSTEFQISDFNDRLLLDFFNEGLWSHRRKNGRTATWPDVNDRTVKEELLSASINWIKGSGLEVTDDWVELQSSEMNKDEQWKYFHMEERDEMAADVESLVIGSLIDDLIFDLIMI